MPALAGQDLLIPCREGGLVWATEHRCRLATATAGAWGEVLVGVAVLVVVWDVAGGDGEVITVTPGDKF